MNQSRPDGQNLEMNHTHFILLDNGIIRNYDIGDYLTRLTKTIANGYAKQVLSGKDQFVFRILIFY